MKNPMRAALAALVSVTAATAALLPAGAALAATPAPSAAPAVNAALLGTWANTNPNTTSVKELTITPSAGGIKVDAWSVCAPTDCEWGSVPAIVFTQANTSGVDATSGTAFRAEWSMDHGREQNLVVGQIAYIGGVATMTLQEPRIYLGHGRSTQAAGDTDWTVGETFRLAGTAMPPTRAGTPLFDSYPLGHFNSGLDVFMGTWTTQTGLGVTQLELSRNPDGSLNVKSMIPCASGLCDIGTTTAVTFGHDAAATNATNFLAPYTFGSRHLLLCIQLEANPTTGAPVLLIHQFTDYTLSHRHGHSDDAQAAGMNSSIVEIFSQA